MCTGEIQPQIKYHKFYITYACARITYVYFRAIWIENIEIVFKNKPRFGVWSFGVYLQKKYIFILYVRTPNKKVSTSKRNCILCYVNFPPYK